MASLSYLYNRPPSANNYRSRVFATNDYQLPTYSSSSNYNNNASSSKYSIDKSFFQPSQQSHHHHHYNHMNNRPTSSSPYTHHHNNNTRLSETFYQPSSQQQQQQTDSFLSKNIQFGNLRHHQQQQQQPFQTSTSFFNNRPRTAHGTTTNNNTNSSNSLLKTLNDFQKGFDDVLYNNRSSLHLQQQQQKNYSQYNTPQRPLKSQLFENSNNNNNNYHLGYTPDKSDLLLTRPSTSKGRMNTTFNGSFNSNSQSHFRNQSGSQQQQRYSGNLFNDIFNSDNNKSSSTNYNTPSRRKRIEELAQASKRLDSYFDDLDYNDDPVGQQDNYEDTDPSYDQENLFTRNNNNNLSFSQKFSKTSNGNFFNPPTTKKEYKRSSDLSQSTVMRSSSYGVLPPNRTGKKYTLVLDLDETLAHTLSALGPKIRFIPRPGVKEFLREMSMYFELVIFTAAMQEYADEIINQIDPMGYVSQRLYRQHLSVYRGEYIKDLSTLGRDLSKTLIIDNLRQNFRAQPNNGFEITDFTGQSYDNALSRLSIQLKRMVENNVSDVRMYPLRG